MSSAGHVIDALNRLMFNNAQRKSPGNYLNKEKYLKIAYGNINHGKLTGKDISKEELQRIREVVREKIKKERRRQIILTISIFSVLASVFIFYMFRMLFL